MSKKSPSFSSLLLAWYKINKRDLPWRRVKDPYKIWISEIMLQQTTVAAVIPYFNKWIECYPTINKLAAATEQDVMNSWEGLGYYSRVRNIHKSAKIIMDMYHGRVPDDPDVLIKLPGFGPYTVGAVLSIAYGKRVPVIDANIRRIVMRIMCIKGKADSSVDPGILPWIESVMPDSHMSEFNQAFMELGALICGRQPQCLQCPVKGLCSAYKKGIQDEIPEPDKKKYIDLNMVAAVIRHRDKYFIQKRTGKGVLSGLWEFPCGEMIEGESAISAAGRIVQQISGRQALGISDFVQVRHYYTNHRVKLNACICDIDVNLSEDENRRMIAPADVGGYAMHSGSVKIADKLFNS